MLAQADHALLYMIHSVVCWRVGKPDILNGILIPLLFVFGKQLFSKSIRRVILSENHSSARLASGRDPSARFCIPYNTNKRDGPYLTLCLIAGHW